MIGNTEYLCRRRRLRDAQATKARRRELQRRSAAVGRWRDVPKYHGALDAETAAELEALVERRREERVETYRERVADFLDEPEGESGR